VAARLQARESRNCASILRGATSCLFCRASRLPVQATYPSIECRPMALSAVGEAASEYSTEFKNEWRNTSTPI